MSQLMDYTRYLAKEIGPRPAGTAEEQQAALYLTERFQKDAGFNAEIEEFQRRTRPDLSQAILGGVMAVATLLAMFVPALAIPAFILSAAAAGVFVAELMGTPLLSRVLASGNSQNVVAKYQPNPENEGSSRAVSRKIILVAHYDSGRVTPPLLKRFEGSRVSLSTIAAGGMVAEAVLMLLRIFIAISGGGVLVVLNALSIIALLVCLIPVLKLLLVSRAPFNEGANNNATGSAALLEIACRISQGCVSEADLIGSVDSVTIHGGGAAREAGLVPEGATLIYEAAATEGASAGSEEERLLAAKAAIAALTGKPVERRVYSTLPDEAPAADALPADADSTIRMDAEDLPGSVDSHGTITQIPDEEFAVAFKEYRTGSMPPVGEGAVPAAAPAEEPVPAASAPEPAPRAPIASPAPAAEAGQDVGGFQNAPSWFVAAQKNAKKPSGRADIHRSRYTEAMENAERERHQQEEAQAAAAEAAREAERKAREAEAAAAIAAAAAEAEAEKARAQAQQQEAAEQAQAEAPAEVVVEAAVEVEAAEPAQARMPRYADDAAGQRMGVRETAVQAQMVSEETVAEPAPAEAAAPSGEGSPESLSRLDRLRSLRTNIPSLSGVIRTKDEARKAAVKSVPDVLNKPIAMDAPATPAPKARPAVADILSPSDEPSGAMPKVDSAAVTGAVDYNMVVTTDFNPQTDGDFAANLVPDGAAPVSDGDDFAAPVYEEQPRRGAGFFDRFRHKREEETMESPQEWLGVNDDFDARSVGRARGGWESFRNDDDDATNPFADDGYDTFDDFGSGDEPPKRRRWEGGSASRHSLGHVDMRSGEDAVADETIPDVPPEVERDRFITGEIERIYHFRNPVFNTEIWFVAMGSDDDGTHDGVQAFLEEHKSEMRGSTVIEVESLGAGALAVATREGEMRKISASSRIKRYTRDAVASTGIALDEVDMSGTESIASIVQKAGFQSMHLFGAENGRPALKGSADDVIENVDELLLNDYVNFVFELLKR